MHRQVDAWTQAAELERLRAERDDLAAKLEAAQAELDGLRIWAHFMKQTADNMLRDLPGDGLRKIYTAHIKPPPEPKS